MIAVNDSYNFMLADLSLYSSVLIFFSVTLSSFFISAAWTNISNCSLGILCLCAVRRYADWFMNSILNSGIPSEFCDITITCSF